MIDILHPIISLVKEAGELCYDLFRGSVTVSMKADQTPVTQADRDVNDHIAKGLQELCPHIPLISEEQPIPSIAERQSWPEYWLLDPSDGTHSFINDSEEFVICLAYMVNQQPIFGLIHQPVTGTTWMATTHHSAVKIPLGDHSISLPIQPTQDRDYTVLVSVNHNDSDLSEVYRRQRQKELGVPVVTKSVSSALKFAYIAEGLADEYVRFTPTHDWDIAAGDCLVRSIGKSMLCLETDAPVKYGSESLLVPPIIVR